MKIHPVSVDMAKGPEQQSEDVLSWKCILFKVKQKGRWSKESISSGYSTAHSEDEKRNGADSDEDNGRQYEETDEESHVYACVDKENKTRRHAVTDEKNNHRVYSDTDEDNYIIYADTDKEDSCRDYANIGQEENAIAYADIYQEDCARKYTNTDEEETVRVYEDSDEDNGRVYTDTDKDNGRVYADTDEDYDRVYTDTDKDNGRVYADTDEDDGRVYTDTDEDNGRVYADTDEDDGRVYTDTDEDYDRVYTDTDEDNGRVYTDTDEGNGRFYGGTDKDDGRVYTDTDEGNGRFYGGTDKEENNWQNPDAYEEENGRQYVTTHEDSDRHNDGIHKNSHSSKNEAYTNNNQRSIHKPNSRDDLFPKREHYRYNQKVDPVSKSNGNVISNDERSADEEYRVSGFSNESRSDDEVSTHTIFSTCTALKNDENRGSEGKIHRERKELNTDEKPKLVARSPMVESTIDMDGQEEAADKFPEAGTHTAGPYQLAIEQRIESAGHKHHSWLYDAENLWTYLRKVDLNGDTQLMCCCCHATHLAACYYLVKRSLDYGLDINHKNKKGETALWNAAFFHQPILVGYLMECGADPTVNVNGESAVRRCVRKGYTEVVEVLLTAQTSFHVDMKRGNDQKDCSLLSTAAEFQHSDVIKLLVEKLLAKNDTDCLFENLTETIRNNWLERLQYILEHVPNSQRLTTMSHTHTKMTLMHEVALHDDLDVVTKKTFFEILQQHGADANSKDICDLTPTHAYLKLTN